MVINKPPMGFNTWNTFGGEINEKMIMETADALVSTGLKDAGYNYLVIDDCWAERERGTDGRMVPNKNKFPNGMKKISDYVHSKGLKFGMYSCLGTMTCAGYPGSYNHEYLDAKTFAEWGVDFLKYDYCYRSKNVWSADLYRKMAVALKNSGRDIVFSACSWGHDETKKWIDTTGANMWRATGDINDSWQSIKSLAMKCVEMDNLNFINCFADLDMLTVGMNGKGNCGVTGCTKDEYITHFSFWAFFGSPLMIGCDVRSMDDQTVEILTNGEVIAINQDIECNRPYVLSCSDNTVNPPELLSYAKILENGDIALGFFNFSDNKVGSKYITLDMLGLTSDLPIECKVKDLWTGEEVHLANDTVVVQSLEPHACRLLRVSIKEK